MPAKVETIPLAQFAQEQGVTPEAVRLWVGEGMPYHDVRGGRRVQRARANTWVRERAAEKAREETSPVESEERARKVRAEASLKELELKRMTGELVEVSAYEEQHREFVAGLAAVASGRLQRFERAIVGASTPAEARVLVGQIHAALMQGAQDYAAQLEDEADALDEAAA